MIRRSPRWAAPAITVLLILGVGTPAFASSPEVESPPNDARQVPLAERSVQGLASAGDGSPGWYETSQFMIGRVAVAVVLPESTGSQENWTTAEEQKVIDEITAATQWWTAREPRANLEFQVEFYTQVPVDVEPIALSSTYQDESQWIRQAMSRLGFWGTSSWQQVYAFDNDLRARLGADWAFTIFVVDSSNDPDNKFTDGYFAYAYLGGPYMVMTYGNNGYGPDHMDAVAAHEMGHIFWALDQYAAAGWPCDAISGYLGVENQNSDYGICRLHQPSIMKSCLPPYAAGAVDPYARGQLGWRDSDGDGILDPVDTQPQVSVNWTPNQMDGTYRYQGATQDLPFSGAIMNGVTINNMTQVSIRLGNGTTVQAVADDGCFDSPQEDFHFDLPEASSGVVIVQAINSAGNQGQSVLIDAPHQVHIPLVLR